MWAPSAPAARGMLLGDITTCLKIILFSGLALCNITSQQIRVDMEDF
jgi:hypothetical protein